MASARLGAGLLCDQRRGAFMANSTQSIRTLNYRESPIASNLLQAVAKRHPACEPVGPARPLLAYGTFLFEPGSKA